jgi:cytidylate kinase
MIITVDGPSAAGKGTLARGLAAALGFAHLDTGLLYRAVALKALAAGVTETGDMVAIAEALVPEDLRREGLRGEEVSQAASRVAALPDVRAALLAFQRRFADRPPGGEAGVVLDGRDIGTVVCPQADVKFFITASSAARARRRHKGGRRWCFVMLGIPGARPRRFGRPKMLSFSIPRRWMPMRSWRPRFKWSLRAAAPAPPDGEVSPN